MSEKDAVVLRDSLVIALEKIQAHQTLLNRLSADVLALQNALKQTPMARQHQQTRRLLKAVHADLAIPYSDDELAQSIQKLINLKL